MILLTSFDPDPILFSDPARPKQIISDPGGSGPGSATLVEWCLNPDSLYGTL
jgi:hypothetical protein